MYNVKQQQRLIHGKDKLWSYFEASWRYVFSR